MGVAEGGVGDRDPGLLAQPSRERLRPELEQQLPAAVRRRHVEVERWQLGHRVEGDRRLAVRLVDGDVGQVGHQLGAAVAAGAGLEQLRVGLDEARGDPTGAEVRVVEHGLEEGDVGGDAADPELGHRPARLGHRVLEGAATAGELGQHRVEVGGDLGAGVRRTAVEADATAAGGAVGGDHAGVGTEVVGRVLGGDPALQGGAADAHGLLAEAEVRQRLAGGDPELGLDQVDVGDLLGDRVLDLDPRVHLDEDVVAVRVEKELHGAGVPVADLPREPDGVGAHPRPQVRVEVRRRRDLHHLLVPSLDRAVALEQVHHLARAVGQDLHLDVPGVDHGLLDEDRRVAEGSLGLAHAGLDRVPQLPRVVDPAHAAAAAAGDRLDEQRIGQLARGLRQRVRVGARGHARQRGHAGVPGRRDRPRLVAGQRQHLAGRPDEGDAGVGAGLGQGRVLAQEAVARVDGVRSRPHRGGDDRLRVEVGPHRVAALADLVGLVRLQPVLGPAVLVREDRHRPRPELVGGPERPDRDLAAVGHEDLREHAATLQARRGPISPADAPWTAQAGEA